MDNTNKLNLVEGCKVRSNIRGWSLVAGALIILAACIFAYLSTRPAEADVASLINMLIPTVPWAA